MNSSLVKLAGLDVKHCAYICMYVPREYGPLPTGFKQREQWYLCKSSYLWGNFLILLDDLSIVFSDTSWTLGLDAEW